MLFATTIMVAVAAVTVSAHMAGGHGGGVKPGRFIDFAFTLDGECEVERPMRRHGGGRGGDGDDVVGLDADVKRRGVETDEFGELVDKRGRGGFQRRGLGKKPKAPLVDFDLREVVSQLEDNRDLSNAVIGVQINDEEVCGQADYLSRQSLEVCFEIDPCDLPRPVQAIFRPDRPERDGPRGGDQDDRKRATDDEMRAEGAQLASLLATALLGNTVDVRVPPEAMSVRQPMGLNSNVRRGAQQEDENKGKGNGGRPCRPVVLCADVLAAETPFVENLRAGTLSGQDACLALANEEADDDLRKRSTEGIDIGDQFDDQEPVAENLDVVIIVPNFDGIMDTFQQMETNTDEEGAEMMGMIITWFAGSFGIFDDGDEQAQVAVADATDDAGATLFEFVCNTLNLPCDSLPADLFGGDANRRRAVQGGDKNKKRRRPQLGVRASVRFCQRVIEDINGGFVAGQCCPFDFATLAGSECDFDVCCAPEHQGFHVFAGVRRRGEQEPKYGYIGPDECATECSLVDCGCGDAQCCGLGHTNFYETNFEWNAPRQCRRECQGHDCDRLHRAI